MEKTEEKDLVYMGTKKQQNFGELNRQLLANGVERKKYMVQNRIKKVLLGEYQEMSAAQEKKRVSKGEKIWESQRKYYQLYLH